MTCQYFVKNEKGEYVDFNTLTKEQQQTVKDDLGRTLANEISYILARRDGKGQTG